MWCYNQPDRLSNILPFNMIPIGSRIKCNLIGSVGTYPNEYYIYIAKLSKEKWKEVRIFNEFVY